MGFETTLFVEPPNETLFCGICSDVLKVATTACSQGHAFCKACLIPSVTSCPTCRGTLQKTNCLPIQRIIEALRVKCPNQGKRVEEAAATAANQPKPKRRKTSLKGKPTDCCDWVGPLADLERHEKDDCKFKLVNCEYDGCNQLVFRKNQKKHSSTCDCRPSECNKCKERVTHKMLREHKCPKEMTACPYCNKRMLRQELLGAGSPTFVDETSVSASAVASRLANSSSNSSDDNDDSDPPAPRSGIVLLSDIMNEQIRFVPTDAQCQGHYKVCQDVPLRCEFHEQGCTDRICRKDLAQHHKDCAQHHAALVAQALRDVPARLEEKLSREHATVYFGVNAERFGSFHDYRNLLSCSTQVASYDFRLKFHQQRASDEPIAVSIRANVGSAYTSLKIDLYDISIKILADCPTGNASEGEGENDGFFKSAGPHTLQRGGYGIVEFQTHLCVKDQEEETCTPMTGAHISRLIQRSTTDKLYVVASFSVAKRTVKDLGGIYDTTSPCHSPSRDYADY